MSVDSTSIEYIGMSTDSGICLGSDTTVPIAFYGGTPVAYQTSPDQTSCSDASGAVQLCNELRNCLVDLNLIKGSA